MTVNYILAEVNVRIWSSSYCTYQVFNLVHHLDEQEPYITKVTGHSLSVSGKYMSNSSLIQTEDFKLIIIKRQDARHIKGRMIGWPLGRIKIGPVGTG